MSRPKGSKNKRKQTMADATTQEPVKPQEPVKSQIAGVNVAIDEEADQVDSYRGACQNCLNHNKTTELNMDGTCPKCGFDKSKLYGAF